MAEAQGEDQIFILDQLAYASKQTPAIDKYNMPVKGTSVLDGKPKFRRSINTAYGATNLNCLGHGKITDAQNLSWSLIRG
jgi:hypothetical protein